jgi:hypothetical protein
MSTALVRNIAGLSGVTTSLGGRVLERWDPQDFAHARKRRRLAKTFGLDDDEINVVPTGRATQVAVLRPRCRVSLRVAGVTFESRSAPQLPPRDVVGPCHADDLPTPIQFLQQLEVAGAHAARAHGHAVAWELWFKGLVGSFRIGKKADGEMFVDHSNLTHNEFSVYQDGTFSPNDALAKRALRVLVLKGRIPGIVTFTFNDPTRAPENFRAMLSLDIAGSSIESIFGPQA